MTTYSCTYELRDGETVVSTGRLTLDDAPIVGGRLQLGDTQAEVDEVRVEGIHAFRLVLRLL